MRTECEERGIRLAVLIDFPLHQARREMWEEKCPRVETHMVNGYLLEREERYGTPAFIPVDGHWTKEGHRWIAEYLYHHLIEKMDTPAED